MKGVATSGKPFAPNYPIHIYMCISVHVHLLYMTQVCPVNFTFV